MVEFALVAPVVLLFLFCGIMFFGVMMTQNSLVAAVREGGRVASLTSVTSEAAVIDAVQERLQLAGVDIDLVSVTVSPDNFAALTTGAEVSVSVSMPLRSSTWIQIGDFLPDANLGAENTFLRE